MRVLPFFILCWVACVASAAEYTIETGEIQGAHFTVARPARWNRQILLVAHGHRKESAELKADLYPERAAYRTLLQEGWVVAKSSYRRNGVIIRDAVEDLDRLREHLEKRLGPPERVIVEGESMGGLIALLIAERVPDDTQLYHGVVAIGPALQMRDSEPGVGLTMQPKIPVVLLANRSEYDPARLYAEVKLPTELRPFVPALLRVNRDGHINVNQAERLVALRALIGWLDYGTPTLPTGTSTAGYLDATRIPEPLPSRVFLDDDKRGFTAHVSEATTMNGNLLLDVQPADFEAIGLAQNAWFQATIGEQTFRVFFGTDFKSVNRGEWVVFENADGFYWLARNGQSAAATARAQVGDVVHIRRYDPPPAK